MNNLKQKNVIYKRDVKDVLPHTGKGDSIALASNSNVTDARLNNAFQQLVNNDLYLENRLVAGLDYQPGPEGVQSESIISALPDGSKRWVNSDDYAKPLQIYKKTEVPLSQSVGLVRGASVSFIAPVGDAVFAAFSDKLMYDRGAGLVECADSAGASVVATGYCDGSNGTFFVSSTSVYRLVQFTDAEGGTAYRLQKLNSTDMTGLKCVQYDAADGMLYVGGDGGFIARGRCSDQTTEVQFAQDIKFCAEDVYGGASDTNRYLSDITVNALQTLDRKDYSVNSGQRQTNILAATDGGMFRSDTRFFLETKTSSTFAGKTCVDVVQHEGAIYVLASDGYVYRQIDAGNMTFQKYPSGQAFTSPTGFASHSSGLYVACAEGVYRYVQLGNDPEIQLEYEISDVGAVAVATLFSERIVFAAVNDTVYYYSTPGKVRSIRFDGCSSIRQIVAQARSGTRGSFDVYVIGENGAGSEQVFAAYIGFDSGKTTNFDRIDGEELVFEDVESVVCGGSCYYFSDGVIYNQTTGQRKRLGDVRVHQMEYLSSDGSLALATDAGFQVLNAETFDVICQNSDGELSNTWFASQSGSIACFATLSNIYVAQREGASLNTVSVGGVGDGYTLCGVATDGDKIYAIGKAPGAADGVISSASLYYVRSICVGDDEGGETVARLEFPVMPFMAEVTNAAALGISAGKAYRLAYDGSSPSCESVTFPDTAVSAMISAFCMVGSQVFVAADGEIRQYECSAAEFDPKNMKDLVAISSTALANVDRLVYSGTDTIFDMRVYAKQGENGLSVYTPSFENIFKYEPATTFSDFIMYIDHDEGEDEEDDADDVYYAIMLGIGADANLHIISSVIGGAGDPWIGSETISALPAIDAEYDGVPQSDRTPYQVFYTDNSTAYVAYTAKIQEDLYSDYILAINLDDLKRGGIGDTLDFARLGSYSSSGQAGVSRFTGFNIPGSEEDDEDIDVIATCYRDELRGYTLATFKVDVNRLDQKLVDVLSCTYFQEDPRYRCFQPDCVKLKIQSNTASPITDDYYIAVPAITPDGNILRTYIFKYINSSNTCDPRGYADVEGVGLVGISSVYVSRFMQESESAPLLVVVDADGRVFNVKAVVGETVRWSGGGIVSQVLDGTQFQRIVRCGFRQLVGFDKSRSFVYDFQTGVKQVQMQDSGYISNLYFTDTDDGRNYMLIQHTGDGKIYSVDPVQSLKFNAVTGLGDSRKTLIKTNDTVFVIAWDSTEKIYQENAGGRFTKIAEGGFDKPDGGYKDAQIFYGRISDRGNNDEYYVFLLKQSGGVDVYAMVGSSSVKTLQKVYEFKNPIYDKTDPNTSLTFSYIQYAGYGSNFDAYLRKQAFNGIDHYDWPILMANDGAQEYMYLDFQSRPDIRCTQLEPLADSQYVSIGKDGETVYCVKVESSNAVIYSIAGVELGRCDVASHYAWLVRGKCVFQKTDGGIRYYDGEVWCDFGSDLYDFFGQTEDGLYYFVKAGSGMTRNLYKSVSIAVYPIKIEPVVSEIKYTGLAAGSTPVRLASGRTYAGLVCQNGTGIRNLCILWPIDEYGLSPTGPSDFSTVVDYSVYACPASFNKFPDGRENTVEVVPIGNYLDEVIAYEGGYLHIAHIVESKLITDRTGYSVIPVINTLPWTDLGACFGSGIRASAKLNGRRYVTSGTGLSSFTEGSSGMAMKILSPIMKADGVNARSFYEIGQNAFLIATDKGVYRYQHLDGTPVVGRMSPGTSYNVAQVTSYSLGDTVDTYLIANMLDGYLYSSENCRVWKKQFCPVPAPAQLRAVYPKNAREWYFGASTGLYKSTYKYSEVDDLAKFTEDDLYQLYAELLSSDISSRCEDEMSKHELDGSYALGHLSSLMHDINADLLGVNFDGLQSSGWQHHMNTYNADEYSVSNDIVFEQFWGSNADWNLALSVENQFISAANAKFTYLLRRWMSGITEIYVHIPTTNTYYINHVASTPNYNIDEDTTELSAANVTQFGRNKTVFKHNPNEPGVYTTVKLALSRHVFFIDQMLEVQACGNSLPLKIYKETIRENGSDNDFLAAQYFNSYVAPTVLMSTAQTEDDYIFNFACFGADEQVVKLQFIDTINRFDQEYCQLVFDSNGLNADPDTFVKQRIRLDSRPYSLRRNQYQWPQDQQLFAGWTFTPNPAVNVDTSTLNGFYNDRQQITSTEIEDKCGPIKSGQDVKLYAVWITYHFGASDTTILMSPQPGKTTFRLGSADMIDDERIGDKMIIKFEEVD